MNSYLSSVKGTVKVRSAARANESPRKVLKNILTIVKGFEFGFNITEDLGELKLELETKTFGSVQSLFEAKVKDCFEDFIKGLGNALHVADREEEVKAKVWLMTQEFYIHFNFEEESYERFLGEGNITLYHEANTRLSTLKIISYNYSEHDYTPENLMDYRGYDYSYAHEICGYY